MSKGRLTAERVRLGIVHTVKLATPTRSVELTQLPVHPVVVAAAHTMLAKRDRHGVERLVWADPGLALAVLAAVNAEHAEQQGRVGGLRQAVVLAGNVSVAGLIAAKVVNAHTEQPGTYPHWLWTHSLLVATASSVLARRCGLNADEAYTTGLIHDVGWLDTLEKGETLPARDRTHAATGAALLAELGLNQAACAAVNAHHDFVDPSVPLEARVLLAAHSFATEMIDDSVEKAISTIEGLFVLNINARPLVVRSEIEQEIEPLLTLLERNQ